MNVEITNAIIVISRERGFWTGQIQKNITKSEDDTGGFCYWRCPKEWEQCHLLHPNPAYVSHMSL